MLQMRFDLIEGFELLIAVNGRQGLDMASAARPDLILMDVDLPDMNGLDVVRLLKGSPETSNIPVIAVTAHAMSGDREKALAAGCDDFDTKPVNFDRLLTKINALLKS
jgi:CheY-like chemotaxis protein